MVAPVSGLILVDLLVLTLLFLTGLFVEDSGVIARLTNNARDAEASRFDLSSGDYARVSMRASTLTIPIHFPGHFTPSV